MAKLTDRECKLSKTEKKDLFLGDGGGLYLRIRPGKNCIKSWLFRYKRLDGSGTKWMDIGFYPDTSLLEARSIAIELKRKLRNNIDPTSEAEAQLQAEEDQKRLLESRITLIKLFERWEKLELANRKDKGKETRRRFEKDIFPVLGSKPIEEITRVDIANALDAIVERGAKIIARSLLGELRQMFGFGIGRGILDNDPTSHMKRDSFGKKVERDRVLSEAELKLLPNLLSNASMLDTSISAIWIMLGTCCRVGEIIRARWEDIDFEKREWTIPPEHAKNAKKHVVHLSAFSAQHFKFIKEISSSGDDSSWVLPATNNLEHVDIKSLTKQISRRQRGDSIKQILSKELESSLILPKGKWTSHDLRRTGATLMGTLGVRPEVIEKCLNHLQKNVLIRIYQRQELVEEQREAWNLLGTYLSNIAPFKGNSV